MGQQSDTDSRETLQYEQGLRQNEDVQCGLLIQRCYTQCYRCEKYTRSLSFASIIAGTASSAQSGCFCYTDQICSSNADCSSARFSLCHSPCYDADTYTWNAKAEELRITEKFKERHALVEAQRQKMLEDSRRQRQRDEQKELMQRIMTRVDLETEASRRQRQRDEQQKGLPPSHPQKGLEARGVLTIKFARVTGSIDTIVAYVAYGQNVGQQTKMVLRTDLVDKEVVYISRLGLQLEDITATLVVGKGEQRTTYTCKVSVLLLNKDEEKQWKQLCKAKTDLRVQIEFVMRKCVACAPLSILHGCLENGCLAKALTPRAYGTGRTGVGGGTAFAINAISVTVPQVEKTEL
jgi:hypothetical protein